MILSNSQRARSLTTLALGLGLFALVSAAVVAQPEPRAEPAQKILEQAHPSSKPSTIQTENGSDLLARAIADLGESPFAAMYDAAGPDVRAFAQHNMTLSNPFFEGRVPGSNGNRVAADYIEYWFKRAKLEPAFPTEEKATDGTPVLTPNTSFRQPFSQGTEMKVQQAALSFNLGPAGTVELERDTDFTVLGSSGSGKVTGPIVLAGYAITEGNDGYKTFVDQTDLTGKIAVVFRFEPMKEDGKSKWVENGWSPAASIDAKLQALAERHAAGIIVVNPPGAADPRAKVLSRTSETRGFGKALSIPIVMASTEAVDRLVQAGDPTDGPRRTLLDFRKICDAQGGVIPLPNATASILTGISYEPVMTDNVGGVLMGKGTLKDQYIVIGAHYDHVGYGPVGTQPQNNGKLHPGADDNGSGTSGLLVLTEKLANAYAELPASASARSILFLTFSAEESGLIGSNYYVRHPSIALDKVDLMLNMDMIGRLRGGKLEVQGTESARGLYDWLKPFFDDSGLVIAHGSEVAGNSDHASFYQKKLPVLFFFTGLHREYHTPQDTGFTISQLGAGKVIDLVYRIALAAAQRPDRWEFTPRREQAAANDHAGDQPVQPKGVGRVRFGIAPGSYSDDKPGVEVGDVYEGTPAAEAGIKVGDRMIKWNGKDVANVEEWMPMLGNHKPGDVVDVTLLRDGKEITLKVTLKARNEAAK